jgi:hypothetical protein
MQCSAARVYILRCFVVVAVVACLLVLYSIKQFENMPLQQDSHARMQFDRFFLLQHGSSARARSCMQFDILPLQETAERLYAV